MAGKYREWLEPENLEKIANWAANGCTNAEIAKNVGIHRSTLSEWTKRHHDVSDAIKRGRAMAREAVENALFKRAVGYVTVEVAEAVDGDGRTVRRTVTRELPPDTTAIIFYLKNRMPERYSDRRVNEVQVARPGDRPGSGALEGGLCVPPRSAGICYDCSRWAARGSKRAAPSRQLEGRYAVSGLRLFWASPAPRRTRRRLAAAP